MIHPVFLSIRKRISLYIVLIALPLTAGCLLPGDELDGHDLDMFIALESAMVPSAGEIRGELTIVNRTGRELELAFQTDCQLLFTIARRQEIWQYVQICTDVPNSILIAANAARVVSFDLNRDTWDPQIEQLPGQYLLAVTLNTGIRQFATTPFEVIE
ncbi:MAG: hypothetical protein EA364_01755 [Balneolaceae bacterium]|nr:MAG: hypothetical protein EA364_01755 [Balneolaceae bacterium]